MEDTPLLNMVQPTGSDQVMMMRQYVLVCENMCGKEKEVVPQTFFFSRASRTLHVRSYYLSLPTLAQYRGIIC